MACSSAVKTETEFRSLRELLVESAVETVMNSPPVDVAS